MTQTVLRLPEEQSRSHHRRRERHRREHREGVPCAGKRVAILDYNQEAGQALARELGERVHFEHNDVRDIPALQAAIRRASEAMGPITILVNNAARDDRHTIDEVTPEYWRERFATNLDHQFAAQAVLPDMEKAGAGSIVNMGSTSYMVSDDAFAAYKTAKSAVVGLTRALARELGPQEHPRQLRRAGLDHDPAPARPLAHPRGRGGAAQAPMREAQAPCPRTSPISPCSSARTIPPPCRRRPIWWTAGGCRRRPERHPSSRGRVSGKLGIA